MPKIIIINIDNYNKDIKVKEDDIIILLNHNSYNIKYKKNLIDINKLILKKDYFKIIKENEKILKKNFIFKKNKNSENYNSTLKNFINFNLYYFVNFYLYSNLLVEKLIKKYKINKIEYHCYYKENESVFSKIFKNILNEKTLKYKKILKIINYNVKINNNKNILEYFYNLYNFFKNIIFKCKNYILVNTSSYRMIDFLKEYNLVKYKCFFLEGSKNIKINNIFSNKIFFQDIFNYKRIEKNKFHINSIINTKIFKKNSSTIFNSINIFITKYLSLNINNLLIELKNLEINLNKKKPKFIFSNNSLGIGYFLGEYAYKNNINNMIISHGTHVNSNNRLISLGWENSSKYLIGPIFNKIAVQSPLMESFLKKNNYDKNKFVFTGPVAFESYKKSLKTEYKQKKLEILKKFKIKKNKIILLHASTPKHIENLRPITFETIDEYIYHLKSLINLIKNDNDIHLIIKFRPMKNLSYETFKKFLNFKNKNVSISLDDELKDLLFTSKALISYSSTIIEEMLNFKKPLILMDLFNRYCHIDEKGNKKRSNFKYQPFAYCNTLKKLRISIDEIAKLNLKSYKYNGFWKDYIYDDKECNSFKKYLNKIL